MSGCRSVWPVRWPPDELQQSSSEEDGPDGEAGGVAEPGETAAVEVNPQIAGKVLSRRGGTSADMTSYRYSQVEGVTLTPERALAEAEFFFGLLVARKMDAAAVRNTISVPAAVETRLLEFCRDYSTDARAIEATLRFRRRVLREFERLAATRACNPSAMGDRGVEGGLRATAGASARGSGLEHGPVQAAEGNVHTSTNGGGP